MNFAVENIAKVKYADIVLNGITVIAGENDTGKSTIGKALYSMFNSFYQLERQIEENRWRMIHTMIHAKLSDSDCFLTGEIADIVNKLREQPEKYISKEKWREFQDLLEENVMPFNPFDDNSDTEPINWEETVKSLAERINELLHVTDEVIQFRILQQRFNSEFYGEMNYASGSDNESGHVSLSIRQKKYNVDIKRQKVIGLSNAISLETQAIYIDNPFALDDMARLSVSNMQRLREGSRLIGHKAYLLHCLVSSSEDTDVEQAIEDTITERRVQKIIEKIDRSCEGEIVQKKTPFSSYQYIDKDGMALSLSNISAGMKTFMIIKQLLRNRSLKDKGLLILDEPEIHLHPEWQILFAEIIVLLQKEYDMHILLTTHSPYFLRAIQVYSANYNIADQCKYYLSTNNEEGRAILQDVTTKTKLVYDKLLRPFEQLQSEQYSNDKA